MSPHIKQWKANKVQTMLKNSCTVLSGALTKEIEKIDSNNFSCSDHCPLFKFDQVRTSSKVSLKIETLCFYF